MAQIGAGDMPIPAIQGADINDGDIINGTQQQMDDMGRLKFHYSLPDGSPLESDWVMPDFAKSARRQWVEAVRQAIVSQAQRASEQANINARNRLMEEKSLEIPTGASHPVADAGLVAKAGEDPAAYAKAALVQASSEAEHWGREEASCLQKKTAAEAAVRRWTKVLEVLRED